ncbi:MAG: ribose-phosphate diphosphokinase [Alphaproteobacteria bacterium]|nr:MAG: ribose-phosphate diphosphokinase [Alphaproteobacteria bacterium]
MVKKVFQGDADEIGNEITENGFEYAIPPGRRAPMHRMHAECVLDILRSGLKPVLAIGSVNGPESKLWNPVKNPLTVEQQKEQFRRALPGIDYNPAMILELEDTPDDKTWIENFHKKVKDLGIESKSVVYFRSKSSDAATAGDANTKPLSEYTQSFVDEGMAVWQSYNANPADDNISASAIRAFDLNHLTVQQRRIIGAPDYIVSLAREARDSNPDKALLEEHNVPLTVLDLSLDRMRKEAGISTAAVIQAALEEGPVSAASLALAATDLVKERAGMAAPKVKKPLLVLGNSVSEETAEFLKTAGAFSPASASIGKFPSGEPFAEIFYGDKKNFAANVEKIKGAECFVVQSTGEPVADNIQHLLLMIHTLKFYGAKKVTAVVPFLALSREDRAFPESFWSVGADLMARQLKVAGADGVITFTMHSKKGCEYYQAEFGDNFVNVDATEIFARHLEAKFREDAAKLVVGAPDGADKPNDEGIRRASALGTRLTGSFNDSSRYLIAKHHTGPSTTEIDEAKSNFGCVKDRDCVEVDDLVDGGGTGVNGGRALKKHGARSVSFVFTHAILTSGSGTALEKMLTAKEGDNYVIDNLAFTDSVPEARAKIEAFAKQYPDLAKKIGFIPLGPAILAEVKKQLANKPAETSEAANSNIAAPKPPVLKAG